MPLVLEPNAAIVANLRRKPVGDEDLAGAKGHAAGILFVAPDGDVLLLRRGKDEKNFASHWALPGGKVEDGEAPEEGAFREALEEMGPDVPRGRRKLIDQKVTPTGLVFHTFAQPVDQKFTPALNGEHQGYNWSPLNALPSPMHPAVQGTLNTRLGLASDMSPQDWGGMVGGLLKFLAEEVQEPEHAQDAMRPIINLSRDTDGMFVEPDELTPDIEMNLAHNRERFANHFNYADNLGAGNQNSYDERGDYNCGRCNQAQGDKCLLLDIHRIDRTAGSCEDWEKIRLGDPEMRLDRKSPDVANYGVAENGVGFGCARCPYSRQAKNADSEGRSHWCGEGGFHIIPTACCTANGAPTVEEPEHAQDKSGEFEHEIALQTRGDFDWKGLLHHMHSLGSMGASRDIIAMDSDDKPVRFNWDGDGADKIVNATIDGENILTSKALAEFQAEDAALALDRESVRTKDMEGRLHVSQLNISKACVNPYKGSEIPGWSKLGLDKDKVYYLLRDPEELAKAAATSNGVQILRAHKPVSASDHKPSDVVGAIGNDATFQYPYLQNSATFWPEADVEGIESGKKKQLSMGYRYTPDMTPGDWKGTAYDGVMRDIICNHVALVEDGRAGSDVCVADSADEMRWVKIEAAIRALAA